MLPARMAATRSLMVRPARGPVRSAAVMVPVMSAKPQMPVALDVPKELLRSCRQDSSPDRNAVEEPLEPEVPLGKTLSQPVTAPEPAPARSKVTPVATFTQPEVPGWPGTLSGTTIGPATPGGARCRWASVGLARPNARAE